MIVERLLHPGSKLATHAAGVPTLAEQLGVEDADENYLYGALDWLLARQKFEKKLAALGISQAATPCSTTCPAATTKDATARWPFGHSRDRKKGQPVIVYGVLADRRAAAGGQIYPGKRSIRRRCLKSTRCVGASGCGAWCWWATAVCGRKRYIEHLGISRGLGWISAICASAHSAAGRRRRVAVVVVRQEKLAEIHSPDCRRESAGGLLSLLAAECFANATSCWRPPRRNSSASMPHGAAQTHPAASARSGARRAACWRYKMGKHFKTTHRPAFSSCSGAQRRSKQRRWSASTSSAAVKRRPI